MSQNNERKREERKDGGREGGKETGRGRGREQKEGRMGLSMVTLVVVCSTVFLKVISTVFNPHLHPNPYCFNSSAG